MAAHQHELLPPLAVGHEAAAAWRVQAIEDEKARAWRVAAAAGAAADGALVGGRVGRMCTLESKAGEVGAVERDYRAAWLGSG